MPRTPRPLLRLSHRDPTVVALADAAGIPASVSDSNELTVADQGFPLHVIEPGRRSVGSILDLLDTVPDGAVRLVTGATSPALRSALERRQVSWIDGRGAAHLIAYGLDQRFGRADRLDTVLPAVRHGLRLGPATVRAVQLLLDSEPETWRVTELARRADISKGSASSLLRGLSTHGYVEPIGASTSVHFDLVDRSGLARWFLSDPATRARREHVRAFVYAREPLELAKRLATSPAAATIALSGGLAALVSGAGMTSVALARIWVDPTVDLLEVIDRLDADPSSAAPNVDLLRDVGRVGIVDRRVVDDIPLAPPSRVWADLHDEPRGEDQALIYRETRCAF